MKEFIEIPFGAKDSELCGWEYTIPEGFVASIENGKIVVKKEESEDERIRKTLIEYFKVYPKDYYCELITSCIIAWLEKQGESDETKAKTFLINKGYPIDTNGRFPTYEEMYDIIKEGLEKQGEQKSTDEMIEALRTEYEKGRADAITEMQGEQKPLVIDEGKAEMDYCFTKMMNGEKVSSGWSEDDYSKVQRICKYLNEAKEYYADITEVRECIDWLKSFKDRVQPQWKPEDIHLEALRCVINGNNIDVIVLKELLEQLKKL